MAVQERTYRFIISGGGTGGHIFPAISIAHALKASFPDVSILFVGAKGKMEMEKVPAAGFPIKGLWISGIQRSLSLQNLAFPLKLIKSLWDARAIIKAFQPDAVIGVGGYASGPLLYAATWTKVPTLIQEQNSHAGLTNKWLGARVSKICVAYQGMERFFPKEKIRLTGNPVRKDILKSNIDKSEALAHFGLTIDKKTILVIGGSLGARTINNTLASGLNQLLESGVQVIWQTGKFYFEEMKARSANYSHQQLHIAAFINRMDLAYAAADVVVSRAGALSISELCLVKKPVVFVPSPNVAEDHQTKNATALVKENAALMVTDANAPTELIPTLMQLVANEEKCALLRTNIEKMALPNATDAIVEEIKRLVA